MQVELVVRSVGSKPSFIPGVRKTGNLGVEKVDEIGFGSLVTGEGGK